MAEPTSELLYLEELPVRRRVASCTHVLDERQITALASEFAPQAGRPVRQLLIHRHPR